MDYEEELNEYLRINEEDYLNQRLYTISFQSPRYKPIYNINFSSLSSGFHALTDVLLLNCYNNYYNY